MVKVARERIISWNDMAGVALFSIIPTNRFNQYTQRLLLGLMTVFGFGFKFIRELYSTIIPTL